MLKGKIVFGFAVLILAPFCCFAQEPPPGRPEKRADPAPPAEPAQPSPAATPVPLPFVPPPVTYWIDPVCKNNRPFMAAFNEALLMATRGKERLSSSTDTLQQTYFEMIFKQPAYDAPAAPNTPSQLSHIGQNVFRRFEGMASLTEHLVQAESNIRFHCDNDEYGPNKRWTLTPDIPGDPHPNSQRTAETGQEWQDDGNGVRIAGIPGCQLPSGGLAGITYVSYQRGPAFANQNYDRASITICDLALNGRIRALSELPTLTDLSADKRTLSTIGVIASVTVLHELTHAMPFHRVDIVLPAMPLLNLPARKAYGWADVQLLTPEDSEANSENYAYFGLLARIGDSGFRLSADKTDAAAGKLTHSPNTITSKVKRMMKFWTG